MFTNAPGKMPNSPAVANCKSRCAKNHKSTSSDAPEFLIEKPTPRRMMLTANISANGPKVAIMLLWTKAVELLPRRDELLEADRPTPMSSSR